ncbi:hypothetical protein [Mesonia maritima]|uniref:Adhesin domain-containing protein n=1 Tax=Mesonia maritima TaxID=1793873 RepID=A0ABU1K359_9FLAO|nr:hypothetical protein [Mesonia maritima]MDR6300045.1 hypothetical protein [Mesonia maritima]
MKRFHNFYATFIIALLSSISGFGQRESVQIFEAETISELYINADEVFKITLETTQTDKIKLAVFSEGEYTQQIGIKTEQKGNQLHIFSAYPEILTSGYDKLSAHKVFAVILHITLPKHKKVIIQSNIASVYASGTYNYFETELTSGKCSLTSFSGEAIINTIKGDVLIETNQANLETSSTYGSIKTPPKHPDGQKISAKSIYGNIIVKKTQ